MITVHLQKLVATVMALVVALGAPTLANSRYGGMAGCSRTPVPEEYTAVRYVDAEQVDDLRIEWNVGSASVVVADDTKLDGQIAISETAPEGWSDVPHMTIEDKEGELVVCYGDTRPSFTPSPAAREKSLTITLPRSCANRLGTVTVGGSVGEYALEGITCETLGVHLEAGIMEARGVAVCDLVCSASSGHIGFDGTVSSSIDVGVSSGTARVRTGTTPKKANLEASSGTVELLLPRNAGFTAQVKVGAGSFDCDFKTTERDGRLVAGDGEMSLSMSVSSGTAHIGKR